MTTTRLSYGMKVPDLSEVPDEKWNTLLQNAPAFRQVLEKKVSENGYSSIGEYEKDWPGDILCEVIKEAEKIPLCHIVSIYDAGRYLALVPNFPWEETDEEKRLTPQTLSAIFAKYTKMLTDEPPVVGFRTLFVELGDGDSVSS